VFISLKRDFIEAGECPDAWYQAISYANNIQADGLFWHDIVYNETQYSINCMTIPQPIRKRQVSITSFT